jgi:hypothetical protein
MVIVVPVWTVYGSQSLKNNELLFGHLILMPDTPWSTLLPPTGSCTLTTLFALLTTVRLVQLQWFTMLRGRDTNSSRVLTRTVAIRHGRGLLTLMPLKIYLIPRAPQKTAILEVQG